MFAMNGHIKKTAYICRSVTVFSYSVESVSATSHLGYRQLRKFLDLVRTRYCNSLPVSLVFVVQAKLRAFGRRVIDEASRLPIVTSYGFSYDPSRVHSVLGYR
jgi:hypothetical protein